MRYLRNGSDRYIVDANGRRTDEIDKACFEVEDKCVDKE